jgi:hypothetical protein
METIELVKLNGHTYKIYVISNGKYIGNAIMDIDGYYYYWPSDKLTGSWSSYILREIADTLDELNKEYEKSVKDYFRNNSQ